MYPDEAMTLFTIIIILIFIGITFLPLMVLILTVLLTSGKNNKNQSTAKFKFMQNRNYMNWDYNHNVNAAKSINNHPSQNLMDSKQYFYIKNIVDKLNLQLLVNPRVADIFNIASYNGYMQFEALQAKTLTFVVCDRLQQVLCCIELLNISKPKENQHVDMLVDQILQANNIPLLRSYDITNINIESDIIRFHELRNNKI